MTSDEQAGLIEQVRRRIRTDGATDMSGWIEDSSPPHPPLTDLAIAAAQRRLAFSLPPSLRALYTDIANGGFGPAYGLLGLVGGALQEDGLDAVGVYERARTPESHDPHWRWPDRLLPVVHLGCAMFFCVDCSDERGMVVWFEPNPHEPGKPWDDAFVPLGISFADLMVGWAGGADSVELMEAAYRAMHPDEVEDGDPG